MMALIRSNSHEDSSSRGDNEDSTPAVAGGSGTCSPVVAADGQNICSSEDVEATKRDRNSLRLGVPCCS